MWIVKKLSVIAVVCLIITLFAVEASAEKRIGVLMFSEETRYSDATKGIIDQLKKEGFADPKVKFIIENALGNKARAAELVQKFAGGKLDLIFTLGTSATIAVSREIKDVPIVFYVFDPVETGISKSWKSSGNNTTGASSMVPMQKIIDSLKAFAPIKTLAVLYTPGEKNSEAQLKELQKLQAKSRIRVIPAPLTKEEEIVQILPGITRTADSIFLSGSAIVGSNVPKIVDITNKAKVLTISHLEDIVEKGALLGVSANPYQIGLLAGKKGAKILKGAKPSSIPIEPLKKFDLILNMKSAKAGELTIPPKFMKKVTKTLE